MDFALTKGCRLKPELIDVGNSDDAFVLGDIGLTLSRFFETVEKWSRVALTSPAKGKEKR